MRGLKYNKYVIYILSVRGRTSHEVRGLKSFLSGFMGVKGESHLTRGAWIEIHMHCLVVSLYVSHLTRGAWIEIIYL